MDGGFMFDPDAWLTSVRIETMTAEEERGYLRLLLYAWRQPDCGLPDDDIALATLAKIQPSRWRRSSGAKLRRCFFAQDGRLYNERLLRERQRQLDDQQFLHSRAVAGAAARWGKTGPGVSGGNANDPLGSTGPGVSGSESSNDALGKADPGVSDRDPLGSKNGMLKHPEAYIDRSIDRVSVFIDRSESDFALIRESLRSYMERLELAAPDDVIVKRVFDAAPHVSADEINELLCEKFKVLPPGTKHGPRTYAWFPAVVRRHFAEGEHGERKSAGKATQARGAAGVYRVQSM